MQETAKFVAPGEGRQLAVLGGDVVTVKVAGTETGGAYALLETMTPPSAGPPRHVHQREDETFYVVEGQFQFEIGEATLAAGPGSVLLAPRNIPHRFTNTSATPGRMLVVVSPAGMERFFDELARFPANAPDPTKLLELFTRYGLRFA